MCPIHPPAGTRSSPIHCGDCVLTESADAERRFLVTELTQSHSEIALRVTAFRKLPAGLSGNTIVQIRGDGNTVITGLPRLVLTRYFGRREIRGELDRLSPYTRSVRLIGRAEEMTGLETFLRGGDRILVRVLTGSSGSGKTRLALELCEKATFDDCSPSGAW